MLLGAKARQVPRVPAILTHQSFVGFRFLKLKEVKLEEGLNLTKASQAKNLCWK